MIFNASIGVCRKVERDDELVIIPQDQHLYNDNDLVLVISTKDFSKLSNDIDKIIKLIEEIHKNDEEYK
ncbi:MAG: hypothetical protein ACP5C3_05450 [Methanomicrobiales archaeon]